MHVAAETTTTVYFSGTWIIFELIVFVLYVAGLWATFVKAGHPGWGALIPIYNIYLLCKTAERPGWWVILYFIPFVNIVIHIIVCIDVAKNFGHGAGFGILLWLFGVIMFLVLGFGSSQYKPARA